MSIRSSVRALVPAAVLVAAAVLTTACSAAQAGTAVLGSSTAASTVASSSPVSSVPSPEAPATESPTSDAPTTQAPTTDTPTDQTPPTTADEPTTVDQPTTADDPTGSDEPPEPTDPTEPTGPAHPSSIDQVTGVWLDTMCTDVHTYLGVVLAVPTVSVKDNPEEYRQAWLDFLGANAYQMENMVGNMSQLDPPNLPNGPEVQQAYVDYFTNLKNATVSGWELIDAASADPDNIGEIVEQGVKMMEAATKSDMGLGNMVGAEYKGAMEQIDSCAPLLQG
jgi:hypothetical protein